MYLRRHAGMVWLSFVLASGLGAQAPLRVASLALEGEGLAWSLLVPNVGSSLRVRRPDGQVFQRYFPLGARPEFGGGSLQDGQYVYELALHQPLQPRNGSGDHLDGREGDSGYAAPQVVRLSGAFRVQGGAILSPTTEPSREVPQSPGPAPARPVSKSRGTLERDVVTADDAIITGSLCVGFDCVDNENFGFTTLKLKENNLRILFEDTSSTAGFPSTDWQLTANDSALGGLNRFSLEDITGAKIPFTVEAGAPTNALYIDDGGRMGFGTSVPVLPMHQVYGNTPALRLDQSAAGGWTPQVWDVAGNESNFFIRDVTGGSLLPFRIKPGAPTNSLYLDAAGNVGLGTASPGSRLTLADGDIKLQGAGAIEFPDGTRMTTASVASAAVTSLNGVSGDVNVVAAAPLTLSTAGNTLTLGASLPPSVGSLNGLTGPVQLEAMAPLAVATAGNVVRLSVTVPTAVSSLNGLTGPVLLAGGENVQVASSGNTISVSAPAPGEEGALQLAAITGQPDPATAASLRLEGTVVRPYSFLTPVTVSLRYAVPSVPNLAVQGRPVRAFKVRYQDSDGAGTSAQVVLRLHRSDMDGEGDEVVWSFDSNQHPATGQNLHTVEVTDRSPGTDFHFARYAYWLEASLSKRGLEKCGFSQIRMLKVR